VCDKKSCTPGIVSQAIRPNSDSDFLYTRNIGSEQANSVLPAVRREDKIGLGDERAGDSR